MNTNIIKEKMMAIWDKLCEIGRKIKEAFINLVYVAYMNPEKTAVVVLTTVGVAKKMSVIANRRYERNLREHTIWDNREHHRWNVRRQPTSLEWIKIHDMQAMGYSMGEALEQMNLLKR